MAIELRHVGTYSEGSPRNIPNSRKSEKKLLTRTTNGRTTDGEVKAVFAFFPKESIWCVWWLVATAES